MTSNTTVHIDNCPYCAGKEHLVGHIQSTEGTMPVDFLEVACMPGRYIHYWRIPAGTALRDVNQAMVQRAVNGEWR